MVYLPVRRTSIPVSPPAAHRSCSQGLYLFAPIVVSPFHVLALCQASSSVGRIKSSLTATRRGRVTMY